MDHLCPLTNSFILHITQLLLRTMLLLLRRSATAGFTRLLRRAHPLPLRPTAAQLRRDALGRRSAATASGRRLLLSAAPALGQPGKELGLEGFRGRLVIVHAGEELVHGLLLPAAAAATAAAAAARDGQGQLARRPQLRPGLAAAVVQLYRALAQDGVDQGGARVGGEVVLRQAPLTGRPPGFTGPWDRYDVSAQWRG